MGDTRSVFKNGVVIVTNVEAEIERVVGGRGDASVAGGHERIDSMVRDVAEGQDFDSFYGSELSHGRNGGRGP